MKLFKEMKCDETGRTEYRYVDAEKKCWSVPPEYWGPITIEVPIDKVKECEP